ncbi:MAG: sulfotransferase [Proteobacteria bacterium]|nr:sulfotransferase [Pseudomonadota bacterium]
MAAPVLMFGVGAAKSGTSWLYQYLAAHPDCHLRSIKELHFFDTRDMGNRDWYLRNFTRKADEVERGIVAGGDAAPAGQIAHLAELRLYTRVLDQGDTTGYLAFVMDGREDERLVGDITPSYGLLSEDTLREMAALHEDVRFVYVMRDPVARLWSHVRMVAGRRGDGDLGARAARLLDEVLAGTAPEIAGRGDYAGTIGRLMAAVAPEKRFICTSEDLFGGDALARLCAFLDIAPFRGKPERRVHGGVEIAMTDTQRRRAAAWLRPQYDCVAANMGALPPAWQASLAGM